MSDEVVGGGGGGRESHFILVRIHSEGSASAIVLGRPVKTVQPPCVTPTLKRTHARSRANTLPCALKSFYQQHHRDLFFFFFFLELRHSSNITH